MDKALNHRESFISAHHNYLVNNMLTPGFLLGDPNSQEDFFFLADLVLPGEITPRISARLFDSGGRFLLEMGRNRIVENPGRCTHQSASGGFRILYSSGESLLEVNTQHFTNGYLTRIQGKLYDRDGRIRMEPSFDGVHVFGEAQLTLQAPYLFSGTSIGVTGPAKDPIFHVP